MAPSWASSIPTWALLALALFVAWRVSAGGGASAVSELTASNHALTERLQQTRDEMGAEIRDLRIQNAELRGKTDVALVIAAWGDGFEKRARARDAAMLGVLDLIAKRLGPDTNGVASSE